MNILVCSICNQEFPESYFWKRKNRPKGYSSACKDCCNKQRRERYTRDKDAILARNKEWRIENQKYLQEYEKKRNQKPKRKEAARTNARNHYENNKEYYLMKCHKRRSLLNGAYTQKEWNDLCNKYNNKCLACDNEDITIDHVIPISLGGINTIDNLQPLCLHCNLSKGIDTIDYRGISNV